jgi:5'-nucleotidase
MTVVVTNDDGVDSPGIHVLAALLRSLGHEPVVVAPARDMSGASAAIGKIELDVPTQVRRVTLPPPAADIPAYAVEGPPGRAALLAARRGIDDVEPSLVVSGINAGTNTGQAILHSGTVGAALTGASFGLSGLAVSLAVTDPMPWDAVEPWLAEALELLAAAPPATVLNVNVPATPRKGENGSLRWATLDRFGSFRVSVAERRESLVQLEYRSTDADLDPSSDTALVDAGIATVTAIEGIRAVPPEQIPFAEPRPAPEARLASGPRGEARAEPADG